MKKRNIFIALVFFSSCVFTLTSCEKKERMYLYNWTYYTPSEVLRNFEKEFDCIVKEDSYASNEQMYAKIKAGAKGYDVVVPSQDYASIMIKQGMLRPLDQSKMTNKKHINPSVLEKATYDPDMKYCVPYFLGATGIAVNKKKVDFEYARDWSIFSDTRFKGHATMMDDMREVMSDALIHLGYSVNSLDDKELKEATELLINEWKPNLVKFDAEGFGKSFASGDVWLSQGYAEVVFGEVPEDEWEDTIDYFIPEEGGMASLDSMCILKDAPNPRLANEFLNYIHRPDVYAKFLDAFNFPCTVNKDAEEYMTTTPMYSSDQVENCQLMEDLGEGLDKYNELWQKIRFTK